MSDPNTSPPTDPEGVVSTFTPIVPGRNSTIWAPEPMLRSVQGQRYLGRLFVEVWDKETRVVGLSVLFKRGLATLRREQPQVQEVAAPWTDQPVTPEIQGQSFLGRVVVEIWNDKSAVAIQGQATQVRDRAIQELLGRQPAKSW
jgi:hypothetical protein